MNAIERSGKDGTGDEKIVPSLDSQDPCIVKGTVVGKSEPVLPKLERVSVASIDSHGMPNL